MITKTNKIIFIIIVITAFLSSEALINKIDRLKVMKKEAVRLEKQGYYDKSVEEAKKIKELSALVEKLVESTRFWYQLAQQIKVAKQIGADKRDSENYNQAFDYYKKAENSLGKDDPENADFNTEEGLKYINLAIANTKEYFENEKNRLAREKNYEIEVVEIDNKLYVVRLIPKRRDSLWRIAEYEFIYNDPFKWKIIYQANLDKIKNPDLIYPGQKLIIPPLPSQSIE